MISGEKNLFERDSLGEVGTLYNYTKDEILYIDEEKELFIVTGQIIQLLSKLKCEKAIDYITSSIKQKYPTGGPDTETIYVMDLIDKSKLKGLIYEELDRKEDEPLFLIKEQK